MSLQGRTLPLVYSWAIRGGAVGSMRSGRDVARRTRTTKDDGTHWEPCTAMIMILWTLTLSDMTTHNQAIYTHAWTNVVLSLASLSKFGVCIHGKPYGPPISGLMSSVKECIASTRYESVGVYDVGVALAPAHQIVLIHSNMQPQHQDPMQHSALFPNILIYSSAGDRTALPACGVIGLRKS